MSKVIGKMVYVIIADSTKNTAEWVARMAIASDK